MSNPIGEIGKIFAAMQEAPPAPVMAQALVSMLQKFVVDEVVRRGPSANYFAVMRERGFDDETSEKIFGYVFREHTIAAIDPIAFERVREAAAV